MSSADKKRGNLLFWLGRRYLWRYRWQIIIAFVFMMLEGSMFGFLSYMMKPMFDQVLVGGSRAALTWVGIAIFSIFMIRALASIIQKVVLTRVSQLTVADIRNDLLTHLMRLDGSFHQKYGPGYLMQRIEGDVASVSKVWSILITGTGRDMIALVSLFGVAITMDWRWTLIALVGVPLMVAPSVMLQRYVRRYARHARDISAGLSTRLNEIFHGIVPIKLNRLEKYQAKRYKSLTKERVRTTVASSLGQSAIPGLIDVMSGIGICGVLIFGGGEIISGQKSVGDFMAFFTAIGLAFEPLRRLGAVSGTWQIAAASIERIKELLELEPELRDPPHPVPAPKGVPEIVLSGVELNYSGSAVLRGTSFTAEAGKTTALVGASGAGKSTVFNVLTRLVDPDAGEVTIGGVRTDAMKLAELRGLFSVVSQDALLFEDSLRENILLGREDVPEAELDKVLEAAHVSDFVPRLPDGLDSLAGTRGSNLSGGQRQRVAIARALLRDTPILLLDEATSALDAASEQVVQAALDQLSAGRTTLVIAHRLSTIRHADKIVVMDAGHVVEQGSHDELLALGGAYARLHAMQFEDEQTV